MKPVYTKVFQKNVILLIQVRPNLKTRVDDCIRDFMYHLFQSTFYRKKLSGFGKRSIHELELGGDMRIIVEVLIIDDIVKFLNIGTHSQLNTTGTGKIRIS